MRIVPGLRGGAIERSAVGWAVQQSDSGSTSLGLPTLALRSELGNRSFGGGGQDRATIHGGSRCSNATMAPC